MARVLMLSPFLPHPGILHAGGYFLYHLIRSMPHEVHLLCYGRGESSAEIGAAQAICASLTIVHPSRTLRDKFRNAIRHPLGGRIHFEMRNHIHHLCDRYNIDLVHLCWTEMGRYIDSVPRPVVLQVHDVEFIVRPREIDLYPPGHDRRAALKRANQLIAIERHALPRADAIIAASENDKRTLKCFNDQVSVLLPYIESEPLLAIPPDSGIAGRLLFFGALDRIVNRSAARFLVNEVLPAVRTQCPHAHLIIAGANPPADLAAPGVTVTGYVDDLPALWASAQIAVLPSFVGGGILVKVMQALYAARPVITTSYGNEGTAAPVTIADDTETFVSAVINLLHNGQPAQAGRDYARRAFKWDMDVLESVYRKVLR